MEATGCSSSDPFPPPSITCCLRGNYLRSNTAAITSTTNTPIQQPEIPTAKATRIFDSIENSNPKRVPTSSLTHLLTAAVINSTTKGSAFKKKNTLRGTLRHKTHPARGGGGQVILEQYIAPSHRPAYFSFPSTQGHVVCNTTRAQNKVHLSRAAPVVLCNTFHTHIRKKEMCSVFGRITRHLLRVLFTYGCLRLRACLLRD